MEGRGGGRRSDVEEEKQKVNGGKKAKVCTRLQTAREEQSEIGQ
jgi:hypothetical protein